LIEQKNEEADQLMRRSASDQYRQCVWVGFRERLVPRLAELFFDPCGEVYVAFFARCFSASGWRTCGFTAVSSTGEVPATSELKVALAGTR
jgi:hypothetical protein